MNASNCARSSAALRRVATIRLDVDSIRDAWIALRTQRKPTPVFVICGRVAIRASTRPAPINPCDLVGNYTRDVTLADLDEDVRCAAEQLAAKMMMEVAA